MRALHLFIRSSEMRFARGSEIDFRNQVWTLPATREAITGVRYSGRGAKMRTPHIVPLSQQAISGNNELVFPGGHGFRAMACSALMESGLWPQDAIERQMSHQERNGVRAAYIHKAVMQWGSDYLAASK